VLVDDLPIVSHPDEDHGALLIEGHVVARDLTRKVSVEGREGHIAEDVDGQIVHVHERMFESAEGRPLAGSARRGIAARSAVFEFGELRTVQMERLEAFEVPSRSDRPDLFEALTDLSLGVSGALVWGSGLVCGCSFHVGIVGAAGQPCP
jgi:hypothetical protein